MHVRPRRLGAQHLSRAGCLGTLVWAVLWAVLAFLPLGFVDDLIGAATHSYWPLIPKPDGTADPLLVHVPVGSRMGILASELDGSFVPEGHNPVVRCTWRDGSGPWTPLPDRVVPVLRPPDGRYWHWHPKLHLLRLHGLTARTGTLTVACAGTDELSLQRIEPGARSRFTVMVRAVRVGWPLLVTLVMWGPVTVISKRRRRGQDLLG